MSAFEKVSDISALASCLSLAHLNATGCASLVDLSPLRTLPSLVTLSLSRTAVLSVTALTGMQKLEALRLRYCYGLASVEALGHASSSAGSTGCSTSGCPALKTLDLGYTSVSEVHFLTEGGFPSLRRVRLRGSSVDASAASALEYFLEEARKRKPKTEAFRVDS